MRKTGFLSILLAAVLVSGWSIQDLMFWKKKDRPIDQKVEPESQEHNDDQPPVVVDEVYEEKQVNIYRQPGQVNKQITLRFYEESLSIPYISVAAYNS